MSRALDLFLGIVSGGVPAIDDLVTNREFESYFLDFKVSADAGQGRQLHANDRKNLAKALSGFANSEGGCLVWGINAPSGAGVATEKQPVADPNRFASLLEGAISGCTVPPVPGVQNRAVLLSGGGGFVVTYIPASPQSPHQLLDGQRYLIRAGESFVPCPHGVLAGMFGRAPRQVLNLEIELTSTDNISLDELSHGIACQFRLWIRNLGPGLARELFFSVSVQDEPRLRLGRPFTMDSRFFKVSDEEKSLSVVGSDGLRVPPRIAVAPADLILQLGPPPVGRVSFDVSFGCSGAATSYAKYVLDAERFDVAWSARLNGGSAQEFNRTVLRAVQEQ